MQCFVITFRFITKAILVNFLVKSDNFETQNKMKINFESYTEADSAP